jgi:hypothetical protein
MRQRRYRRPVRESLGAARSVVAHVLGPTADTGEALRAKTTPAGALGPPIGRRSRRGSPSRQNRASRLKVFFAKASSLATVSAAMPGRQWLGRLRGSRYRAGDHHRGRNDEADHQRHRDYVKFFSASEVNSLRSAHEKQRSRHRHGEPVKEWRCEAGCDRAHGRSAPAPLARLAGAGLGPWPLGGRGRRRRGRGGPAGAPAHCKPQRFGVE